MLDLKNILNKKNFIDPCHPNKDGHEKIANNLCDLIIKDRNGSLNDPKNNKFYSIYINPDYFNNSKKSFYDYYFIEKNINLGDLRKDIGNYIEKKDYKNKFLSNFFKIFI